ncbi:hypothetical protein [Actinomadura yumaensis]|uniref:Uncharacterized protein n=1 Tax=Actinomadura yumaensis TaxID=111807 RepID=A0ABW2CNR8_9ACTN
MSSRKRSTAKRYRWIEEMFAEMNDDPPRHPQSIVEEGIASLLTEEERPKRIDTVDPTRRCKNW